MNIQRMKFAEARGSRIQRHCHVWADEFWEDCHWWRNEAPLGDVDLRIHPDDEHLQYGPLSTALRDLALYEDDDPEVDPAALDAAEAYVNGTFYMFCDEEERSFTYLFMAEMLADEGL